MKQIQLSTDLSLPIDAVTNTCGILGKKGSGKTTTAVCMAEEMFAAGQQIAIIDPLDSWYGLRSSRDGQSAGYPITVLGGDHADVPLEGNSGTVVAEFVVENNASVILSLRHLSMTEQRRCVADFARRLYELKGRAANKTPLHLFIDEADEFIPQRLGPDTAVVFGTIDRLIRRGRSSGIGVTLISQRAAAINKDALTQIDTLIAMRTVGPQDRKALEAWVEAHDTGNQAKTFLSSLASLETGEGWVWSPEWLGIFRRVKFRDRRTFDSSATPKAGVVIVTPKKLAAVNLDQLRAAMAETIERKKADDPAELRKRIAELEARIKVAPSDSADIAKAERRGYERAVKESREAFGPLQDAVRRFRDELPTLMHADFEWYDNASDEFYPLPPKANRPEPVPEEALRESIQESLQAHAGRPIRETMASAGESLPSGERAVLIAIAQHSKGVDRQQISILTGYKRSSRDAYLQRLRTKGFIDIAGDRITSTRDGVRALGDFEPLPTGRKLREYWLAKLPEGERAILAILIESHPRPVDRVLISTKTGYKRSSRDAYIQRLKTRKLVDVTSSGISASKDLF